MWGKIGGGLSPPKKPPPKPLINAAYGYIYYFAFAATMLMVNKDYHYESPCIYNRSAVLVAYESTRVREYEPFP